MKNLRIRRIIVIGMIALAAIIMFEVYWIFRSITILDKQLNNDIYHALFEVSTKLAEFYDFQLPNRSPIHQPDKNYFILETNLDVDPKVAQHYIESVFDHKNLAIDYAFSIYDCEQNHMVYGGSNTNAEIDLALFSHYTEATYYLGVRFPNKSDYLLHTQQFWLAIPAMIIIISMLFFGMGIIELLRQKRQVDVQKDFINNMSHEFKTPITTIGISAVVLKEQDVCEDPERLTKYAEIIEEQNKKLEQQISKILEASLTEKAKVILHIENIKLKDIFPPLMENIRLKLNKAITFNVSFPDENISIKADRFHLSNIIFNLLENAVKYNDKEPEIHIHIAKYSDELQLTITDNGIGIDPRYRKKIFKKFFRIPTPFINKEQGFGLGLHYVKNIVDIHKWKIRLESEVGKGSAFTLIIPD